LSRGAAHDGLPKTPEARRFYRAAKQRFADAELLLEAGRTTGAVYLAGYTVECMLKALVLDRVAPGLRQQLLAELHGKKAHDIEWLRGLYRQHVRTDIARDVARHLTRVATWSVDLRYLAVLLKQQEADGFFESVVAIVKWADGRM
jgi:HEPN domain-containing protein